MPENGFIVQLVCDTCGSENHFERNEDKTYVKCSVCGREYLGGENELLELNKVFIRERAKIEGRKIADETIRSIINKLK